MRFSVRNKAKASAISALSLLYAFKPQMNALGVERPFASAPGPRSLNTFITPAKRL